MSRHLFPEHRSRSFWECSRHDLHRRVIGLPGSQFKLRNPCAVTRTLPSGATRLAFLGGVFQRHRHPGGCSEVKGPLRGAFLELPADTASAAPRPRTASGARNAAGSSRKIGSDPPPRLPGPVLLAAAPEPARSPSGSPAPGHARDAPDADGPSRSDDRRRPPAAPPPPLPRRASPAAGPPLAEPPSAGPQLPLLREGKQQYSPLWRITPLWRCGRLVTPTIRHPLLSPSPTFGHSSFQAARPV